MKAERRLESSVKSVLSTVRLDRESLEQHS